MNQDSGSGEASRSDQTLTLLNSKIRPALRAVAASLELQDPRAAIASFMFLENGLGHISQLPLLLTAAHLDTHRIYSMIQQEISTSTTLRGVSLVDLSLAHWKRKVLQFVPGLDEIGADALMKVFDLISANDGR